MKISVETLLAKMETELQLAKTCSKEENLREKIYSIKILSELLLEENDTVKSNEAMIRTASMAFPTTPSQPLSTLNQVKKLEMDDGDGANGDSLFDF